MLPPLALTRLEVAMHEPPVPPRPEPPRTFLSHPGLERLRDRWQDPRVRVAALLVAALIAGLVWYQLGVQGRPPAAATAAKRAPTAATAATTIPATSSSSGAQGLVMVHVAGAVAHPGVVRVHAGARVVDAVEAAGGGLPGADLDRLNLAAKVADGERIAVAIVGAPAPVEAGTGSGTASASGSADGTGPPALINVNTATETELEELPGIGPTLAAAIVKERERRGGFQSVGELQDVRGIGELRYADIKDLVSV